MRNYKSAVSMATVLATIVFAGCRKEGSLAYIDNGRLMRDVKVFAAGRDSLERFNLAWQKAAEPLKDSVDQFMKRVSGNQRPISDADKARLESDFRARQEALQKFADANRKKASDLDKELSEGAFKKVNAVLQRYREEKGFDMILGTTAGGNILAAGKHMDVTEDAIKYINAGTK